MKKLFFALAVVLASVAGSAGAGTVTYEFTFTELAWSPLGTTGTSQNFFDLTGIAATNTITATVAFDPSVSITYPENYSGSEYVYLSDVSTCGTDLRI